MKSIASKKAGPGGTSSYNSHIPIQLNMHHNFGLATKIKTARTRVGYAPHVWWLVYII